MPANGHCMRSMEAVWTVGKIQNHTICSMAIRIRFVQTLLLCEQVEVQLVAQCCYRSA